MINLMILFLVVTSLVTLLPAFVDMIDYGYSSDALNCKGYIDGDLTDGNTSYNAAVGEKSSIGCLALKLYLPYIVLGVLIAGVIKIFYDRGIAQQSQYG